MKLLFCVAIVICFSATSFAQSIGPSTFNSAGGSATIGTDEFEFSIGEMAVVSTNTAGTITITHGVLQPESEKTTAVDDVLFVENNLSIFPNPTSSDIQITVKNDALQIQSIRVMNMVGQMVFELPSSELKKKNMSISMQAYANGNYMLQIHSELNKTKHASSFTITKSN